MTPNFRWNGQACRRRAFTSHHSGPPFTKTFGVEMLSVSILSRFEPLGW